mmetsp:Transcript_55715/g.165700  ORF Transcript_55715/g.165700 Transcript_55715/m.165700 type:complete len:286 (+) Transcript_55715:844-1701(+)
MQPAQAGPLGARAPRVGPGAPLRVLPGRPAWQVALWRELGLPAPARRPGRVRRRQLAGHHPQLHEQQVQLRRLLEVLLRVLPQRVRPAPRALGARHRFPRRDARGDRPDRGVHGLRDRPGQPHAVGAADAAPRGGGGRQRRPCAPPRTPLRPVDAPRLPARVPLPAHLGHHRARPRGGLGRGARQRGGRQPRGDAAARRGSPRRAEALRGRRGRRGRRVRPLDGARGDPGAPRAAGRGAAGRTAEPCAGHVVGRQCRGAAPGPVHGVRPPRSSEVERRGVLRQGP